MIHQYIKMLLAKSIQADIKHILSLLEAADDSRRRRRICACALRNLKINNAHYRLFAHSYSFSPQSIFSTCRAGNVPKRRIGIRRKNWFLAAYKTTRDVTDAVIVATAVSSLMYFSLGVRTNVSFLFLHAQRMQNDDVVVVRKQPWRHRQGGFCIY
jgi:hypothetical protein